MIEDIKLPPLPKPAMNEGGTVLYAALAGSQLTDYARRVEGEGE